MEGHRSPLSFNADVSMMMKRRRERKQQTILRLDGWKTLLLFLR